MQRLKTWFPRLVLALVAAVIVGQLAAHAAAPAGSIKQPDKVVILSTSDVKGRTNPCG
jgi:hypothetical protein